jgi:hypothetical protein
MSGQSVSWEVLNWQPSKYNLEALLLQPTRWVMVLELYLGANETILWTGLMYYVICMKQSF